MKLIILTFCLFVGITHSKVGFGPGEQEWDFVEVRPGAHTFWWLYYTTADVSAPSDKPLMIWLQGGPGASGTGYGNFEELGPLDSKLEPRNHTWVKDYNVLFIDNPVGTGFSYVENSSKLTKNNTQIAKDLVECMRGFYKKLPEFEKSPLYITAESYGGKMAVEFAQILDAEIKLGKIQSNLSGVVLIDSWISPIDSVLTWAPFLLQTGMIDQDGFNKVQKNAEKCKQLIDSGKWTQATNQWGYTEMVIMDVTHGVDFYNILSKISSFRRPIPKIDHGLISLVYTRDSQDSDAALDKIMNNQVKKALNISESLTWSMSSSKVFNTLSEDFMKPVTVNIEDLLNNTNVNVYVVSGQLDLIVDTPGTYDWTMALKFNDKAKWNQSSRKALVSNGVIEGFYKKYNKLGFYWVNRSGHMVPADNPKGMAEILKQLTSE